MMKRLAICAIAAGLISMAAAGISRTCKSSGSGVSGLSPAACLP